MSNDWLLDFTLAIPGMWGNDDFSLSFSHPIYEKDRHTDGTLIIHKKAINSSIGLNYRILIREGLPILLFPEGTRHGTPS